jgi:hypothetical protein
VIPTGSGREPAFHVWDAADSADAASWLATWNGEPQREVFHHPGYAQLFAEWGKSRARCACWNSAQVTVLFPFIERDLTIEPFWSGGTEEAVDITSPYGYSGPTIWGSGDYPLATTAFWTCFDSWLMKHNVVSEFVRLGLPQKGALPYPGLRVKKLDNIVCPLEGDDRALWLDFKPKVRKNIRAALRNDVRIEVDPHGETIEEFLAVYRHTMDRRGVEPAQGYGREFFERLQRAIPLQYMYFHARHRGRVVATELVLFSADAVYSFLGGTLSEGFWLRPNELLKYEIMLWAKSQGKTTMVLGGGYRDGDGIFQYKRGFAPSGVVPFYGGYRVLHPKLYAQLVENREAQGQTNGHALRPDYFPRYRA